MLFSDLISKTRIHNIQVFPNACQENGYIIQKHNRKAYCTVYNGQVISKFKYKGGSFKDLNIIIKLLNPENEIVKFHHENPISKVRVEFSNAINVHFPNKPDQNIITWLKNNHFNFHTKFKYWFIFNNEHNKKIVWEKFIDI